MLVQKDFLSKLRDFGLNTYESKIWTALLSRGVSTAGELSDIANVPRSRSYDVLESLERKGFIIMKLGKPITYLAVPPSEVIDRIKQKLDEESSARLDMLEHIKSTSVLEELNTMHQKGIEHIEPTDLTGSIKGRTNIYNHLISMIKQAKKSVVIATTSEGLKRKQDSFLKHLEKAKQRGVSITIAVPEKELGDFGDVSKIATLCSYDIRARFCIVDKKELLFLLMDDEKIHPSYEVGVWVKTEFFADVLEHSFQAPLGQIS